MPIFVPNWFFLSLQVSNFSLAIEPEKEDSNGLLILITEMLSKVSIFKVFQYVENG